MSCRVFYTVNIHSQNITLMTLIFHDHLFFLTIPTVDLNHTPHLSGIHHGLGHQMFTTSCIVCTVHAFIFMTERETWLLNIFCQWLFAFIFLIVSSKSFSIVLNSVSWVNCRWNVFLCTIRQFRIIAKVYTIVYTIAYNGFNCTYTIGFG